MTTQEIEDFFKCLANELKLKEEVKDWENLMRKYCRAYIKNENIKFISPEDIYKHLLKLKGVEQFPMEAASSVEEKLEEFMYSQMKESCLNYEDEENGKNQSIH